MRRQRRDHRFQEWLDENKSIILKVVRALFTDRIVCPVFLPVLARVQFPSERARARSASTPDTSSEVPLEG